MTKPQFRCPPDLRDGTLRVLTGEYDAPGLPQDGVSLVLDIGANIGAFAIWAAKKWPDARIHCYEPAPAHVELLRANVAHLGERCLVTPQAVLDGGTYRLRPGIHNSGETSLFDVGEQGPEGQEVNTLDAASLPACDVMKLDTEGSEVPILNRYPHLETVKALLLEWHSPEDKERLCERALLAGLTIVKDAPWHPRRGIFCFVRSHAQ